MQGMWWSWSENSDPHLLPRKLSQRHNYWTWRSQLESLWTTARSHMTQWRSHVQQLRSEAANSKHAVHHKVSSAKIRRAGVLPLRNTSNLQQTSLRLAFCSSTVKHGPAETIHLDRISKLLHGIHRNSPRFLDISKSKHQILVLWVIKLHHGR